MIRKHKILSLATFTTFALLSSSALSATKIGVVGAADDTVKVVSVDGKERIVKLGDAIYADDTIKTNGDGKAQLIFEDRSTITINENSELKIDKFIFDPNQSAGEMAVENVKGAFRFIGGALSKNKPVKIKTPVATIGIRGGIVDTYVQPGGQTDAVFLYGKEMSMTNAQGDTNITTQYGTGFSMSDAYGAPVALPQEMVLNTLDNFTNRVSRGGGAPVPPTPQDVTPNMNFNTDTRQPEPLAAPQSSAVPPAPADAQRSQGAQIVLVEDDSASVMQVGAMLSDSASGEQRSEAVDSASSSPKTMRGLVSDKSMVDAYTSNEEFQQAMMNSITEDGQLTGDEAAIVSLMVEGVEEAGGDPNQVVANLSDGITNAGGDPNAAVNQLLAVDPTLPPPGGNAGSSPPPGGGTAGNNPPPPPPGGGNAGGGGGGGAPETFTAVTDRKGDYIIIKNVTGSPTFQDEGDVIITEESTGRYKVFFDSDAGPATDRNFIIPKLPNSGMNSYTAQQIEEDDAGTILNLTRDYKGYRTKAGGMELFSIERASPGADDLDTEISFVVGRDIFESQSASTADFAGAAADSRVIPEAINGVVLYDFTGVIDQSNPGIFGAYEYNQAAGFDHTVPVPEQTEFGMAIDWNTGTGRTGNVYSGKVQWLPNGAGHSYVAATHGRADASVTPGNDYNISGKSHRYTSQMAGGALGNVSGGEYTGAAIAVGDHIYRPENGPVEGIVMDFATPTNPSGLASDPSTIFGSALANEGIQGAVIKTSAQGNAVNTGLRDAVDSARYVPSNTMYGFASGIKMEFDAGSFYPRLYSNEELDMDDVQVTTGSDGSVSANITLWDHLPTGSPGSKTIGGTFSNTADSVYINDKMYAAQQVDSDSNGFSNTLSDPQGFIVSAGLVNNGADVIESTFGADYRCDDCEFVHWGVWAGSLGDPTAGKFDYASMIPYVAGEVTNPANLPATGSANYKGEAYASVFLPSQNPTNIVGKMSASVDFGGSALTDLTELNLYFPTAPGGALDMDMSQAVSNAGAGVGILDDGAGRATFNDQLVGTNINGQVNGAMFGPNAEEIGGNYIFERTTDNLKGAGIYFGKQRP